MTLQKIYDLKFDYINIYLNHSQPLSSVSVIQLLMQIN